MKKKHIFNAEYSLAQGLYWLCYCACTTFSVQFMQERGYSNSSIGHMISLGNIIGVLSAFAIASWVDRIRDHGLFFAIETLLVVQLATQLFFLKNTGNDLFVSIAYVFNVSCSNAAGGLIVQISSELDGVGSNINYGLARGIGSLFYAATSSILGVLLENASVQLLPYTAVVGLVCQFVLMLILSFQLKRSSKLKNRVSKAGDSNSTPPFQFFQDNKRFCIMMAGVTLMYLSHKLLLNFLIIVVRSVGGGTADMGHITSFMSIMEIPVMVFYDRIARRFTSVAAMQISAFFFVVKAAAFALSTNVAGLYVSSLFQPLSYAVLSIASVRYVHCYITHQDATKAQSMVFGATSVASVFAGSLGGVLYDMLSAKLVLLIGTCLATIGAIVCIISAKQGKDESVKQML